MTNVHFHNEVDVLRAYAYDHSAKMLNAEVVFRLGRSLPQPQTVLVSGAIQAQRHDQTLPAPPDPIKIKLKS